jgi:hypothetical protein
MKHDQPKTEYSSYIIKEQCPNCFYLFTSSSYLKYCEHCGTTEKRKVVLSRNKYKITKKSFFKSIFSIYGETIDLIGTETIPYVPNKDPKSLEKTEKRHFAHDIFEILERLPFKPTCILLGKLQYEELERSRPHGVPIKDMKMTFTHSDRRVLEIIKLPNHKNYIGFR